jgi:hypothetical protein
MKKHSKLILIFMLLSVITLSAYTSESHRKKAEYYTKCAIYYQEQAAEYNQKAAKMEIKAAYYVKLAAQSRARAAEAERDN